MKNIKKVLGMILAVAFFAACLAGCGLFSSGADAASAQPTTITSVPTEETQQTAEATIAPTPEPTPESTPEITTKLAQLQPKDGYMQAKSLEGIDPWNDKVVALTFDDGPSPVTTPQLLDILEKNGVVATFFMLGELVSENPEIVKRAYDAGNEIGTHSWDHSNLSKLDLNTIMVDQYGRTNDAIEAATGLRALIDRPPYGAMNEELAGQIGREQILWSVDPEDWKYKDADTVYDHVINGWDSGYVADGAIILSHDIHQSTVDAYDRIIKELKNEGYKFITVTQMIQIAEIRGKEIGYRFSNAPTAEEGKKLVAEAETSTTAAEEAATYDQAAYDAA